MDRDQHRKILPLIRVLENSAVPGSVEASKIAALQKKYYQSFRIVSTIRDESIIASRREELHEDSGLREIFEVIWEALLKAGAVVPPSPNSRPGSSSYSGNRAASGDYVRIERCASPTQGHRRSSTMSLSKEGFVNLYMAIIRGLTGEAIEDTARYIAELQYDVDLKVFGLFDERGFYDWLLELRATWSDLLHPHFHPFFAWCLLDAIIDVSQDEPFLRPWGDVQCCVIYTDVQQSYIPRIESSKQIRGRLMLKQSFQNPIPSIPQSSPDKVGALGHLEVRSTDALIVVSSEQLPYLENRSPSVPNPTVDSLQEIPAQHRVKTTKAHALQHTMSSVHWRRTKSRWALTHTIKVPFPVSVANVPELPIIIAPSDVYNSDSFLYQYNFDRSVPISSEEFKRIILEGEFVPSCMSPSTVSNAANPTDADRSDEESLHSKFNDDIDDHDPPFFPTELVYRPPPADETPELSLTLSAEPSIASNMLQSSNALDRVNSSIINEHIQVKVASIKNSAQSSEPSIYVAADFIDNPSSLIDSLNTVLDQHARMLMLDSLAVDVPKSGPSSPISTTSHFIHASASVHIVEGGRNLDIINHSEDETPLVIKGITHVIAPVQRQNQSKRRSSSKASQSGSPSNINADISPPKLVGFDYKRADKRASVVKLVHQSSNGELVKRLIPSPEPVKRGRLPETHSLSRSASLGPSSPHSAPRSPSPKAFEVSGPEGSLFSSQNEVTEHEARSQIIRDVISGEGSIHSWQSHSIRVPTTTGLTTEEKFEFNAKDNETKSQQMNFQTQGDAMFTDDDNQSYPRYDMIDEKLFDDITPVENSLAPAPKAAISDRKVISVTLNTSNSLSYASSQTMASVKSHQFSVESQGGVPITPGMVPLPNLSDMEKISAVAATASNDVSSNPSFFLPPIVASFPASPNPEHVFKGQKSTSLKSSKNPYLRKLSASMRSLGYSDRETVPIVSKCSKAPKTAKPSITGSAGDPNSEVDAGADRPLSPKPWIPPGGLEVMENDRLDPPQRWDELKYLHQGDPYDLTNSRSVVKRQSLVRSSFESYINRSGVVKSKFAKANILKDHMSFISELHNPKVLVEVVESKRNTAFMPMTRKNFN